MEEKIDRIVQLDIDIDGYTDEELEEFGVEVVSLVEEPAIGVNFLAFADETEEENSEELHFSEEQENAIIEFAEANGEYLTEDDVIIDLNKREFATVTETVEAIRGLDLLKRLNIPEYTEAEVFYRYSGPPAERRFCKAMVNLSRAGKIFSRDQIAKMNSINSQFAKRGQSSYSVFKYKGGKNCKHYWEQLRVFKGEGLGKIVIVEKPATAIQETAATRWANLQFSIDNEKRIITGPALIPNKMILRRDENGEPYYVFFSKDTVKKIAEKFFKLNKHNNTDKQHDWQITKNNTLLESWISEDKMYDKAYKMGFALPMGTWYLSYKVNDEDTWKEIKEGKIKGFSIAGGFIEKMASDKIHQSTLNSIVDILKQVDHE